MGLPAYRPYRGASRSSGATGAASACPCAPWTWWVIMAPEDPPQGADGHRPGGRPRPVVVHRLCQLRAGLPQAGRHDGDHACRPGGGPGQCSGTGGTAGRVRKDVPLRQCPGAEPASAGAVGRYRRHPGESAGTRIRAGRRTFLRRGLLELPPPWPGRGPGLRPSGQRLGDRLGHPRRQEKTVGDSQRLAGEKGLFEALVDDVVATLAQYEFSRSDPRPPCLQRPGQRVPPARPLLRGAALHPAPGAPHRPGDLGSGAGPAGDVPRPVLPGTPKRRVRGPPDAAAGRPRGATGGNGPVRAERLLLRRGWGRHVVGRFHRRAHLRAPVGAPGPGGGRHRGRGPGRVLPLRGSQVHRQRPNRPVTRTCGCAT